jgi:exodeoxyribonuclease VII large subunit
VVDSLYEAGYPHRCHFSSLDGALNFSMSQLPLFQSLMWSVSDLTQYLRELLEGDELLQDIWVQGEVSNFSQPSSGHVYFTIKDASASLRCVMWRTAVLRQAFLPNEGDAVRVHGSLSIYEAAGQYQLYADLIQPAGEGALYQEFLFLKEKLEAEGLFDPRRKRPVPERPRRIGIVTSPTGAALRDILKTLQRRYPLAEAILAPTAVQGVEAPQGIIAALEVLNRSFAPDVILLARGGGSIEDLWAFNDERVARAIAASRAPVITGVGHETDFTVADFVSDLRAPTPTAAAELATPDRQDLLASIRDIHGRLESAIKMAFHNRRWEIKTLVGRLRLKSPRWRIMSDRQRVDDLIRRVGKSIEHHLELQRTHASALEQRLLALSPASILGRGYAVVSHLDGRLVRSVAQVATGDTLHVQVSDGDFLVEVSPEENETKK